MSNEELLAKEAAKLWESTWGSYIDVDNCWEEEWLDHWKSFVEVVLQAQSKLAEAQTK